MNAAGPARDPWLYRWLAALRERAGDAPVLEIGCGSGEDTATLSAAGLSVIALDLSAESVATARARVPQARIHCQDLRAPFPVDAEARLGAVVASLSLHYFPWDETVAIVSRIQALLRPGGLLLCRLNSTQDHHHGASGHPPIEPGYFDVNGQPKRFFDADAIERLFSAGWVRRSMTHEVSARYTLPKALWEVAVERAGG